MPFPLLSVIALYFKKKQDTLIEKSTTLIEHSYLYLKKLLNSEKFPMGIPADLPDGHSCLLHA